MDIFKILGRIVIDGEDADKQLDSTASKAEKSSGKIGKALGQVGAFVGKATLAAVGAAATGLTVLTKNALSAAGELEQNMGGAEAVFGEYADRMVSKGAEAYSQMGLSQSDFLATANKMGALFQGSGFGIEESADLASASMQRAADVASIMGIDVSSAMEAVAGAAKGNFTMMDNLGVAINDTTLQIYAQEHGLGKLETTQDKVSAAMQMFMEKTEYAAGNYAKENETLAGSLTTVKAAWDNWMSGAGDTDALADSVVNAAEVIIGNLEGILPRLTEGISSLITKLSPKLPGLIQKILPSIITSLVSLINSVASMLPDILAIILPVLTETAPEIINTIVTSLIENLPTIVTAALQLILALATGISQSLPELIPTIVQVIVDICAIILSNLDLIATAGIQLLTGLFQGIWTAFVEQSQELGDWVQENLITPVSDKVGDFLDVGKNVVENIRQGIKNAWDGLKQWFSNLWDSLFGGLSVNVGVSGGGGKPAASGLEYVPRNNFPALLHEGEAVLTASEAKAWRKGSGGGNGVTIVQNISAPAQTPVQLASATAAYFEQARWAI